LMFGSPYVCSGCGLLDSGAKCDNHIFPLPAWFVDYLHDVNKSNQYVLPSTGLPSDIKYDWISASDVLPPMIDTGYWAGKLSKTVLITQGMGDEPRLGRYDYASQEWLRLPFGYNTTVIYWAHLPPSPLKTED